jgi:hypothetical protein
LSLEAKAMKALVWLTILLVVVAKAVPKRQVYSVQDLPTGTELGRASATTSRIIPRSMVDESEILTTTGVLNSGLVQEGHHVVGFANPTANSKQVQLTLASSFAGGIFFAPVRTSSVSPKVSVITTSASSGTA